MAEAFDMVVKDPSLKETYFTTPLALRIAETPQKFRKGNFKGKSKDPTTPSAPFPPLSSKRGGA